MGQIVVATAMDEGFALPVGVMLASLVENLGAGVELEVFILEDRVAEPTKRRVEAGALRDGVTIRWIAPDRSTIEEALPRLAHPVAAASYFRLLLDRLLPSRVERLVYLDGDVVVLGDVSELGRLDLRGNLALAVSDSYAQRFHLSRLAKLRIAELPRFDSGSSYFNSGVMLIDLAGWRAHGIGARALRWARTYTDELGFYDQDALNCALHGRWASLDVAWNLHEIPGSVRIWEADRYRRDELKRAFRAPKIVHFTGTPKPWHAHCHSVHRGVFLEYLARTPWRHRRPPATRWWRGWREALLRRPHTLLEWHLWRGAVQSRDPVLLGRALGVLARYPWLLLTYPLHRARRVPAVLGRAVGWKRGATD